MKKNSFPDMDCKLNLGYHGDLIVEGEVHFSNVLAVVEHGKKIITNKDNLVVDLSKLSNSDSSAVVMLVQWQRFALQQKTEIVFVNCSKRLIDVIRVCGLDDVLYIK